MEHVMCYTFKKFIHSDTFGINFYIFKSLSINDNPIYFDVSILVMLLRR